MIDLELSRELDERGARAAAVLYSWTRMAMKSKKTAKTLLKRQDRLEGAALCWLKDEALRWTQRISWRIMLTGGTVTCAETTSCVRSGKPLSDTQTWRMKISWKILDAENAPLGYSEDEVFYNDPSASLRRTASAGPVLVRPTSSMKGSTAPENLLELRGSEYTGEPLDCDLTAAIRKQSAKRRIKRIMEAEKERAEQERIEEEQRLKEERRRRSDTPYEASTKFRWATRVVIVLGRVLRALVSYSADMIPETATQRSFRTLRDNSEVKEILFNKSLYQRGKSQYAYVPEWAKKILMKSAMERSENELSQLHSMLKGLTSYDKFTYRIQLAMCRAMTYLKVEHPRVVLRKGHIGVSFYFIFSGSVFVNVEELLTKTGHVMWHTAITLNRGDSFGELALLRNIKRTASVVVREDTELLVVEKNVFSKTCPRIFDKELADKIQFCKSLTLFEQWTDDALKNVCFEAQIQEWKANKIIVKDSSKELEWIYLCMQSINRLNIIIYRATMSESESDSEDEVTGAEKILEAMELSYKDEPHAKGDTSYIVNEEDEEDEDEDGTEEKLPEIEIVPTELERRDKRVSENFTELIKSESKTGKLNKDVVYLNIASMKSGDIFDVSEVLRPTGRTLMLVSKGAVLLRIKRHDFFRYSTKQTLRQARKVVEELDYPPRRSSIAHTTSAVFGTVKKCTASIYRERRTREVLTSRNLIRTEHARGKETADTGSCCSLSVETGKIRSISVICV
ncbi:hypothetical protein OS493_009397 [Desmophyllum pertusum]|uniref:Cyclic nucleotide-binding domain-containing protein n=1 Tax=Desmophyllum pertusum TaxID=174260 RepID=A0A9X0CSP1_9CNID|nr:hypothetical protein OS493_009397 [Desmophyllum pertusum]